jgi:tetratricopeptide (TPR) repeat protein
VKIKLWRIMLFLLVVVGVTVAVFPGERRLVSIYSAAGDVKAARLHLDKLLRERPEDRGLLILSSDIHSREGKPLEAIEDLRRVLESSPGDVAALTFLATLYEGSRRPREAFAAWEKITAGTPGNAGAWVRLVDYYRYYGDFEKESLAIASLIERTGSVPPRHDPSGRAVPLEPLLTAEIAAFARDREQLKQDPTLALLVNGLYLLRKQYLDRINESGENISDPAGDLFTRVGELYARTGRLERGRQFAVAADDAEGGGHGRQLQFAELLCWVGLNDEAFDVARAVHEASPENVKVLGVLSDVALSARDDALAISVLEYLLSIRPGRMEYRERLAYLCFCEEDYAGALKHYAALADGALSRDPPGKVDVCLAGFLSVAAATDDDSLTRAALERAESIGPDGFDTLLAVGSAAVNVGMVDEGIALLERAQRIEPDRNDVRRKLADCYLWKGRTKELIVALEELYDRGLCNDADRIVLAQACLDGGDSRRALEFLAGSEGKKILPRREGLLLAAAWEKTGRPEKVGPILKRLSLENRDDSAFLAEIGDRAFWIGRNDLALRFYAKTLEKDSRNPAALRGSGRIYAMNNDVKRAIHHFEAYNRLCPDDVAVRYELGDLYHVSGRAGAAQREYSRVLGLIREIKANRDGENGGGPSP